MLFKMFTVKQRNIFNFNNFTARDTFNDDKIKINKFDVYHENRNELKLWLIQMKIYFKFNLISNNKKIFFAIIYFWKRVQHWIQFKFKKYLNKNENIIVMFFNFDVFEKKFKNFFDVFNEKQTTKRIIQHIIQKTSISDYIVKFQKYFNLTKWNDVILMTMFRRKFKNNVKNEFMRDERKINDLKILMKTTIDFDDRLYERAMKRKYSKRHSKKIENYINNRIYENKINSTRNNREYDHLKTIFMKLNSIIFKKFKQKKCILFIWQKKSFRKKLQIEKRCLTIIQHYAEKKNSKHKKKWKNIDYETIKILSINSENEKFHKIHKSQNFQNVLNEKKTKQQFDNCAN